MAGRIVLKHPVRTLDDNLLLESGTDLSEETLEGLTAAGKTIAPEVSPLMEHRSVRDDMLTFFGSYPYHNIFSEEKYIESLFLEMEHVNVISPILESLDYFLEHDPYSYRHFILVFALSTLLAKDLIDDREVRIELMSTGPSHDIGKICVPMDILKKTVPLTARERGILDNHSAAGYVLLSYYMGDSQFLAPRVARDHHERRDGSGKPTGKALKDFLIEIIAVCDIYDALLSPRPYRTEPYNNRTALEELTTLAEEGSIGWDAVKALVARNRKSRHHYSESFVSLDKRGTPPARNVYGLTEETEQ